MDTNEAVEYAIRETLRPGHPNPELAGWLSRDGRWLHRDHYGLGRMARFEDPGEARQCAERADRDCEVVPAPAQPFWEDGRE